MLNRCSEAQLRRIEALAWVSDELYKLSAWDNPERSKLYRCTSMQSRDSDKNAELAYCHWHTAHILPISSA
jgi:hypothetical protein